MRDAMLLAISGRRRYSWRVFLKSSSSRVRYHRIKATLNDVEKGGYTEEYPADEEGGKVARLGSGNVGETEEVQTCLSSSTGSYD